MINRVIGPGLMLLALALAATASAAPADQTLVTRVLDDRIELSVPVSRLVMVIPRGGLSPVDDLQPAGGRASPRYFLLRDDKRGLNISGWFEPAAAYKGINSIWKGEIDTWKRHGLPAPRNVTMQKIGNWEAVLYDLDLPGERDTHIRSEWVALGTWIDLHISISTSESIETARATAMDVLRSIRVSEAQ